MLAQRRRTIDHDVRARVHWEANILRPLWTRKLGPTSVPARAPPAGAIGARRAMAWSPEAVSNISRYIYKRRENLLTIDISVREGIENDAIQGATPMLASSQRDVRTPALRRESFMFQSRP